MGREAGEKLHQRPWHERGATSQLHRPNRPLVLTRERSLVITAWAVLVERHVEKNGDSRLEEAWVDKAKTDIQMPTHPT